MEFLAAASLPGSTPSRPPCRPRACSNQGTLTPPPPCSAPPCARTEARVRTSRRQHHPWPAAGVPGQPHDRPRNLSSFSGSHAGERPAGPALFLASSQPNRRQQQLPWPCSSPPASTSQAPPNLEDSGLPRFPMSLPCLPASPESRTSQHRELQRRCSSVFCRTEGDAPVASPPRASGPSQRLPSPVDRGPAPTSTDLGRAQLGEQPSRPVHYLDAARVMFFSLPVILSII